MIGGLSMTEVIIILGLALLLLGPDQLPQLAKSLGKGLKEIRKATDDLKGQFEQEIARIDMDVNAPPRIGPVSAVPPTSASAAAAADDPAAARASARTAASAPPLMEAADDPAGARAAARRAAESAKLKLVPPEGAVPQEPKT